MNQETKAPIVQDDIRVATTVRMSDNVHYLAKIEAAKKRMSLSEYVASVLEDAVGKALHSQKKAAK